MARPTVRRTGGWLDPTPFTDKQGRPSSFLGEEVHDDLLTVLGLPADLSRSEAFRARVEEILGEYPVMRELLDDGPRSPQIAGALGEILDAEGTVARLLTRDALGEAVADELAERDLTVVEDTLAVLARLRSAVRAALLDLAPEGRHRPTEHGRLVVLGTLLVFAAEVAPTSTVQDRRLFARRALEAAGIPVPRGSAFTALCRAAERHRGLSVTGEQI